ncbi:MAG: ImmA/IrrE family metallo-endopeptidase, partial [Acidobacteria bacterium]|nr:ImmA/IrrE family metallo-endopeptidase [Acidobacteriota bacterium]
AEQMRVAEFRPSRFLERVADLPKLSACEEGWRGVRRYLAACGIRLVIEEALASTKIDGALFWIRKRFPVIALSLRYDRVDHFWFTLMHELAHLAKRTNRPMLYLDTNLVGPEAHAKGDKPSVERHADRMASEWLVPSKELNAYVASVGGRYFSKPSLFGFAEKIGVHPGIVLGRLQYEGKVTYSHSREFLVKVRHALTA